MTPKLYKVAEVCDIAQLQPYVLRSWEKEFPGIGLQKSEDSARLYRQSDLDQVLRIKQLVFGEGLTLAGARRRLEASGPAEPEADAEEVIETLGADARKRISKVRDGLRSLLAMLNTGPGGEYRLTPPAAADRAPKNGHSRPAVRRGKALARTKARPAAAGQAAKVKGRKAKVKGSRSRTKH